jgi:hypothetical protein
MKAKAMIVIHQSGSSMNEMNGFDNEVKKWRATRTIKPRADSFFGSVMGGRFLSGKTIMTI